MPLPKNLPGTPAAAVASSGGKEGGKVFAERYRQENKLGSGAFGCAYLVTDLKANNERWEGRGRGGGGEPYGRWLGPDGTIPVPPSGRC